MNLAVKDLLYRLKKKKKRQCDDDNEIDERTGPEEDDVPGREDREGEMTKREAEMKL